MMMRDAQFPHTLVGCGDDSARHRDTRARTCKRHPNRYTGMAYYRQLMRDIFKAWEGSRSLRERYPNLRFHIHSESQQFPPPYV